MSKQFLPTTLTDFQVFFVNNESWGGVLNKITPPDIEFKTETFSGSAMGGEKDKVLPFLKALKPKLTFSDYSEKIIDLVGNPNASSEALRLNGSLDRDGVAVPIKLFMQGDWFKGSTGELAAGGQEAKFELEGSLHYYAIEIDNKEVLHVDLVNRAYRTNGVDHWAQLRKQLAGD